MTPRQVFHVRAIFPMCLGEWWQTDLFSQL